MNPSSEFVHLRELIFPDWVERAAWHVLHEAPPSGWQDGYCDVATRTIWVSPSERGDAFLRTLAHEIVHAILGEGEDEDHGPEFWTRLRTAGDRAEQCGLTALARLIREDSNEWEARNYVNRVMATKRPTFDEVLEGLRATCGLTPSDLGERSWRIESVYRARGGK